MPLLYTEYNSGLYSNGDFHDHPYASAFVIFNSLDLLGIIDVLSYWTFSDIFEEGGFISTPFHGGFGLQDIHGIAKPAYRAFELLHESGDQLIHVQPTKYPTAGIIVTTKGKKLQILAFNHNIPNATIQTETLCITINGVTNFNNRNATLQRIDNTHANAPALWESMGCPEYPSQDQIISLKKSSQMIKETISPIFQNNSQVQFSVRIPPEGVAAITFMME